MSRNNSRRYYRTRLKTNGTNECLSTSPRNTTKKGEKEQVIEELKITVSRLKHSSCVCVPGCVQRHITHYQQERDRYDNKTWYHAGGSLDCVHLKEKHVLLYVEGDHRDTLCASYFIPSCNKEAVVNHSGKVVPVKGEEILQVIHRELGGKGIIVAGLRQKYTCSLHCLRHKNGLFSFDEYFACESLSPFRSFDVCPVTTRLCTIDYQKKVRVWDISIRKVPVAEFDCRKDIDHDRLSSILFCTDNPSVAYLTDSLSFSSCDIRSGVKQQELFDLQHQKSINEEICLSFPSKTDCFNFYVGTSERLLLIDTRFPSHTAKVWLHSMTSPPVFSSVVPLRQDKKNEIVCIGNMQGNVCSTSSNGSRKRMAEMSTLVDTLHMYHSKGLVEEAGFKLQASLSTVGLTCVKDTDSGNCKILTQNAMSDIFSQILLCGEQYKNSNWKNTFDHIPSPSYLKASGRWNLKHIHDCLNVHGQPYESCRKLRNQKWDVPQHALSSYKDVLANVISDGWGYDDDTPSKEEIPGSSEKVREWLLSANSELSGAGVDYEVSE